MIRELNKACETLGRALGGSVILPKPGKKELKAAAAGSDAMGAALLAAGVVLSSGWCAALGGISLANGAVLRRESRRKGS